MGKGMQLPFLSHSKSLDPNLSSSHPPWPWPSCASLKTLSFRATDPKDNFRTFNSAFLDNEVTPPDSSFTVSSSSESFSTVSEDSGDPLETVIRGLRSDRLFFEPEKSSSLMSMPSPLEDREHESCSSVMKEEKEQEVEEKEEEEEEEEGTYKESEMLSMESENPYEDFRRSMEEMVEAHGLKDWEGLEELLRCYLKINGKGNHGYIVGAFIDLLVNLSFVSFASSPSSTSTTTTPTTTTTTSSTSSLSTTNYSSPFSPLSLPSSSLTTPCFSSILDHAHDDDDDDHNDVHHDGNDDDDDEHLSS